MSRFWGLLILHQENMLNIRQKIWTSFIAISCFVAFAVGGLNLWYSYKITKEEAQKRLLDEAGHYALELESGFEELETYAYTLEGIVKATYNIDKHYGTRDGMQKYKQELAPLVLSLCKELEPLSMWVVFHPDVAPGPHTVSYLRHDTIYEREAEYSPDDFDLSGQDMRWWTEALKIGSYWSKPYLWANWNLELITYAKLVSIDGKPIAVLGSDFDFNELRRSLSTEKVYKTGYLFLMNDSMDLIVHPQYEGANLLHLISESDKSNLEEILANNRQGIWSYDWDGEEKMAGIIQMNNGWIIGASPPYHEVMAGFRSLRNKTILIVLFVLIASWGVAYLLGNSFTRPLYQLVTLFRKGAEGDLSVRSNFSLQDEIAELGDYFNQFMESMEQLIASLNQSQLHLEVAKLKAEESEKLKTVFLGNISHELRTPLNAILGFTRILVKRELPPETREIYLEHLNESTEQLIQLINGLIDFAQIEVRQMMIKEYTFDLPTLFDELKSSYEHYKKDVEFKVECTIPQDVITGDKQRIEQVFHLLLDNAFKFTKEGVVRCGCKEDERGMLFFVADTGIGIPQELSNVIFRKFRQGDERMNRNYGGLGIGLTLAKALVDLMQGRIWFESSVGKGTTFYFLLKPSGPKLSYEAKMTRVKSIPK